MGTMKQGMSLCYSKLSALFTENEISVAKGLLELKTVVSTSVSSRSKFTDWGCKRRRSSLNAGPPSPRAPSPSLPRPDEEIEFRKPQVKQEDAAAATASPDTPLFFSPSETDEKPRNSSKKRSREEYVKMIEEHTRTRDLLRTELEKIKKCYDEKKAENSELKAKKHEVLKSQESRIKIKNSVNHGVELTQHYQTTVLSYQQPFIADQKFQFSLGPVTAQFYPCTNNGLGFVNRVGPFGIPDLNVSAEEVVDASQPLDMNKVIADKRARFAEARRLRRAIIKINKIRSACGVKLPRHL